MQDAYGQPQSNPVAALGTALGIVGGMAAVGAGAWGAKKLIERVERRPGPTPPVGPPLWVTEMEGVLVRDSQLGDLVKDGVRVRRGATLPIALNTAGVVEVEGPTEQSSPYVTQPLIPLDMIGRDGSRIPLVYLYAGADGEVALRVDEHTLINRGIAYPVTQEATWADGSQQGARVQVSKLVTDLAPEVAIAAYREAWRRVETVGESYSVPSGTRDKFVAAVLQPIVPSYDWSKGPGTAEPLKALWRGVSLMGQIAYQDYWTSRG